MDEPIRNLKANKGFGPNRVEGIIGDTTTANLYTRVDNSSNADVREIVQTDIFSGMLPAWEPTTLNINKTATEGATGVKVEFRNAAGGWDLVAPGKYGRS